MNRNYRGFNMFRRQNNRNSDTQLFVIVGIVLLIGVGIQMNIIKIPSTKSEQTFTRKSKRGTLDGTTQNSPSKKPRDKIDAISCQFDCSSISGSSCVNGKCTDPYLEL